jgi:MoaA/NifB/PqqE/SkfB family radical SAM enzyme
LADLVRLTVFYLKPKIINIPTNGILTEKIIGQTKRICEENKNTKIVINLSLDARGDKHDEIRGIQGNFENLLKTHQGLKALKLINLTIGLHSVISKLNIKELPQLFDYVLNNLKPDQYITEIAENRVELDNVEMNITPSSEDYERTINFLIKKIKEKKFNGLGRLTEAFRLEYYKIVNKYLRQKIQIIPCYAGIASAQISADGKVWPCCIRADNLGSLRDNDYDFKKIWFSEKAKAVRKSIKNQECACPLANASYTNMLCQYQTLFKVINNLR